MLARSGVEGLASMNRLQRQVQITSSITIELRVESRQTTNDETFSDYAIWW